jgi:RNA polymerase sigma-70 factor (ECF subfamily)
VDEPVLPIAEGDLGPGARKSFLIWAESKASGCRNAAPLCQTLLIVANEAGDADLVVAARAGETEAFSLLVKRHWSRLVGLARSIAGEAEAEDLVQECLLTAWRKLSTLREPAAFLAWTQRSVARASVRRARWRALRLPLAAISEPRDPRPDAAGESWTVDVLLARLAPRQRAVMHLTVVEGMSDGEIGARLGIDAASVRSHRRRARERLGPLLREAGPRAGAR